MAGLINYELIDQLKKALTFKRTEWIDITGTIVITFLPELFRQF